jgi:hydroxyacylglutathione hydrolase
MSTKPTIHPFALGEFQTNCFVVTTEAEKVCWIVDCGFDPGEMIDFIKREKLTPKAMLLTHTHVDHIAGIDEAIAALGRMPMFVHRAEAGFCSEPMLNLSVGIGMQLRVTEPDHYLSGGETLELGATTWRVVHTPGHSPGGVCYVHDESKQAIVGDTLFAGSIGRFDFPTSDADALRHSVREVMMSWPDDMTIYPGHGPKTTIGRERATNPYVTGGF